MPGFKASHGTDVLSLFVGHKCASALLTTKNWQDRTDIGQTISFCSHVSPAAVHLLLDTAIASRTVSFCCEGMIRLIVAFIYALAIRGAKNGHVRP